MSKAFEYLYRAGVVQNLQGDDIIDADAYKIADVMQNFAEHFHSEKLASQEKRDAVEFAEWIARNKFGIRITLPSERFDQTKIWHYKKQRYSTVELYEIHQKERVIIFPAPPTVEKGHDNE